MYRLFKTLHGVVRFERMLWFVYTPLLFLDFLTISHFLIQIPLINQLKISSSRPTMTAVLK